LISAPLAEKFAPLMKGAVLAAQSKATLWIE